MVSRGTRDRAKAVKKKKIRQRNGPPDFSLGRDSARGEGWRENRSAILPSIKSGDKVRDALHFTAEFMVPGRENHRLVIESTREEGEEEGIGRLSYPRNDRPLPTFLGFSMSLVIGRGGALCSWAIVRIKIGETRKNIG